MTQTTENVTFFLDPQMVSMSMKVNQFRHGLKANVSDQQWKEACKVANLKSEFKGDFANISASLFKSIFSKY
jgi:predicted double-glycine peptidase